MNKLTSLEVTRLTQAYEAGMGKGAALAPCSNPFPPHTDESRAWASGYVEGEDRHSKPALTRYEFMASACYLFNNGYMAGHVDTIEGNYTDYLSMGLLLTANKEEVESLLNELFSLRSTEMGVNAVA